MKNKIKLSLIAVSLLVGSLSFPAISFADNQEPILIEIYDTDIGTTAYEQLIAYGNGGHAAIGAILGSAQNMESNPGVGFSIGSGGNGYRPSIIIAVWSDQQFSASTGLATIKSYFNASSDPVTTNGDCAIACDGTTQVEEEVVVTTTTTTVVPTTTIAVAPITTTTVESTQTTQLVVSNLEPYTAPTTTVVENVNFALAFAIPSFAEELIIPVSKVTLNKVIKHKVVKPKVCKSKACKLKVCKSKACKSKVIKHKVIKHKVVKHKFIKSNKAKNVLTKIK
jgi:hypothetical protein